MAGILSVVFVFLSLKTTVHQAPLLPRKLLFGNASILSVTLAPCGTKVAFVARLHEQDETSPLTLWIQDLETSKKKPLIRSLTRSIWHYQWSQDGSKLLYLQDKDGDENWRLYSVDCTTEEIMCYTPFPGCQARFLGSSYSDPSTVAVALNTRTPELHDLYTLNIHTGVLIRFCINPGGISQWVVDKELSVRAALREKHNGGKELLSTTGIESEWRVIRSYSPADGYESCSIIGYSDLHNSLYLLESKDYNTIRLVAFNLTTEEATVIMQDPAYDMKGAYLDPETEEIQVALCERDVLEWHILKPGVYKRLYDAVSRQYKGTLEVINSDAQHKRFIVSVERPTSPIAYYLYDDTTRQVKELARSRPAIVEGTLCTTKPITIESRDGLSLHGYLTLPQGKSGPVPLVLLVHDGPWRRIHGGYSPLTQWLTNRGYAALTINYRGSTGYGKEFMNAGNKEWGGAMQQDLIDAVTWSIENNIADPKKVAIMGSSYGGYAALVGATDTPNLFCCAVSLVGISNLVSFIDSIPPYWNVYRSYLYKAVGNPHTERAFLESRSPLFKVDKISIPLFIVQGAQDARVSLEDTEHIVEALKKRGIPHTYLLFEDEGHVFVHAHNKLRMYAELEQFFAHILEGDCER